jgi:hypothetical protein
MSNLDGVQKVQQYQLKFQIQKGNLTLLAILSKNGLLKCELRLKNFGSK